MELTGGTQAVPAPRSRAVAAGAVSSAPRYGQQPGRPYAVAHRGGAGLAVENTMAAFERSYALGFRYLETDVRVTADGVCVAFHDSTLGRMAGVRARVRDLTWAELSALRVVGGHRVPRLEEVLETFGDARFMVDLKDPRGIAALAVALRRSQAHDRVCVAGSADRWLADARAVMGNAVSTAMGWESVARLSTAARLGLRPRGVVQAPFAHVPFRLHRFPVFVERLVSMVHDLGAQLMVWTVDDPERMHRLLDSGVDGIITDRPDLLRGVLVSRGAWTAPALGC
jgi:glycerophosphoryl diester phosphodiesterase